MKPEKLVSGMIEHAERIARYTQGLDRETLLGNDMILEACVFNLSQIGELAGRVDENCRRLHPEIAWNQIRGLRNRLVHDYEGVNRQLLWEIIADDLPALTAALRMLKAALAAGESDADMPPAQRPERM